MDEDSFDNVVYNNTIINVSDPSEALYSRNEASEQNMLYCNTLINVNGERIMLDGNQE
jgi:mannuronan 5-epimerase